MEGRVVGTFISNLIPTDPVGATSTLLLAIVALIVVSELTYRVARQLTIYYKEEWRKKS